MEISATTVKQLRDTTGAGMMDCKRALAETNGDMEAAKDWLRKKGQAIADKKSLRKASEGLIFSYITPDGTTGVLLELNCETDFVARNEAFLKLGGMLLQQIAAGGPGTTGTLEEYLEAPSPANKSEKISDLIRQNVATLGENIGIGRFTRLTTSQANGFLQSYIHPPGKLGVMVEFQVGNSATKEDPVFQMYVRDVAMHVAAAAPGFLNRDHVTQETLDRERDIYREIARNEGKPENLIDKIAQGKLAKFFQQACLLEQEFVKNPDETIQKLTDRVSKELGDTISVVRFERMKVGG